ncbi:MAG: hypothetical protein OXB86_01935 [Bdellovibrionales bacterium]|nr:hypothetical protein [Bdellovibrionales bacterium]
MNCPVCQNDLNLPETTKESIELHYDCPSCFSSLFVKGGKCEVLSAGSASDKVQMDSPPAQETLQEAELSADSEKEPENFMEEEQPEDSTDSSSTEEPDPASLEEESTAEDPLPEVTEVPILEEIEKDTSESNTALSEESEPSSSAEPPTSFEFSEEESSESGPLVQPAVEVEDENIAPEGEDFSDVEQFGNTPAPSGKGAFYYDVIVSDIDSPALREQVEDILEDEALKLEPDQVHFSKPEGRLVINKISPVQTHVIVKSLLGLSLTISWNQHLIADTKLEEPQTKSESMEVNNT